MFWSAYRRIRARPRFSKYGRALCVELARVTDGRPTMANGAVDRAGVDENEADVDAAIAYAVGMDWFG